MPPLVFSSAVMRRTTTRSCRGRNFMVFVLACGAFGEGGGGGYPGCLLA
jgi:hypothetical protein